MDNRKLASAAAYADLTVRRLQFNKTVVEDILALCEQHEQHHLTRDELVHYFEFIEKYDWALTHEVFDIVVLAATGKVKNDSYYRAIKRNLEDILDALKKQVPDENKNEQKQVKNKNEQKQVKKTKRSPSPRS